MSFNTSSRQLPNTDEKPPEEGPAPEPSPEPLPEATAETSTPGASAAAPAEPLSGDGETQAEAASGNGETPAEATATAAEVEAPADAEAPAATSDDTEAPATTSDDAEAPAAPSDDTEAPAEVTEDPAEAAPAPTPAPAPTRGRRRWHGWRERYPLAARALAWTTTALAAALVLFALLMPSRIDTFRPAEFFRIPVEAIFGAAVLIVLPRKPRIAVAALAGLCLGALTVLNFLDIGFNEYLGRGFNVVLDWTLFSDAQAYLQDTMGKNGALGIVVLVVVLVIAVLVLMTLSVVRLGNLVARNTDLATRTTLVMAIVWVTCAALGVQFTGVPIAAEHTTLVVQDRAVRVRNTLRDEAAFAKVAKKDAFANTPPDQLLTGLRGKDMMITFIESYGRSAIEDPVMAPGVDATLTSENEKLTKAGFAAKSGWLTSATYGGSSWLGHSTFLSGLWINNQQRYRTVTAGNHLTLPGAFKKTGAWDTVGVMPGVQKAWPESKFYGIDKVYDSRDLGYKGPKFSWSTMPDQYALTAFERLEHSKKHDKPLMSTIILTSSHQPWAPIPKTVPQDQVGDGSVYDAIEKAGKSPADIITDSTKSKEEYGKSIQYSVTSLIDYLVKYGNKNTVLIFLGDHQPIARVSGNNASRDVPVSIVAKDPKVLDKIADWNWTDGLQPEHNAPVWKMSAFRDRFLTVYGSTPHP
ncbi:MULTISPECIES: sulfatase-like hydrolase/transferase [unclassified Streptomyces]|uniref:sulfatase-like hydrolase/transferase n=1 Tax=unclassified Streptomyces TaxID=2593676 RepID=UPI002E816E36|nr:sulfatase-like hydrolase/transferase [Streptomyces sp. NBC_00589]WTI36778.1 sulfatase-like hydrolase/transferase [Streptomyces sp. NBC_00775]WUB29546.1 sulfatase-like hydrolase/transferase [Streptomyces sp. NBC_00589]